MANSAREQLMKYDWMEGKGLCKDENGITEAIKLPANQNNAGLGYNATGSDPWWETIFNDATKNVKAESHGDEVSLSVVNNTDASCSRKGCKHVNSSMSTFKKSCISSTRYKRFAELPTGTDIQSIYMTEMERKYQSCLYRLKDKIQKKKRGFRTKHIQRIAERLKGDALAHELNTVTKNLSAVDLTEEVNANAFKKKPTQTHFTPV